MLKGLGDLGQIFKIQKDLKNVQKKIKNTKLDVCSPNNEIVLTISGEYYISRFELDGTYVQNTDAKKLEKIVAETVNSAIQQVKDFSAQQMKEITGGLDIPGLSSFLK